MNAKPKRVQLRTDFKMDQVSVTSGIPAIHMHYACVTSLRIENIDNTHTGQFHTAAFKSRLLLIKPNKIRINLP